MRVDELKPPAPVVAPPPRNRAPVSASTLGKGEREPLAKIQWPKTREVSLVKHPCCYFSLREVKSTLPIARVHCRQRHSAFTYLPS